MKFNKILVTWFSEWELNSPFWDRLKNISNKIVFTDKKDWDIIPLLWDVDCLFVKFNGVTQDMIDAAPWLKYIWVNSTWYGKVDVEYVKSKKIIVTNVPWYSTSSVAELTFGILLEHIRDLSRARANGWSWNYDESSFHATEISWKEFWVLWLGAIWRHTAEIAKWFWANVSYWSKSKKEVAECEYMSLESILTNSDIISINIALNSETENLLDNDQINLIKSWTIVINTSPMELIDIDALASRLSKWDITFILDHADEMKQQDIDKISKYSNCIIYPPIWYISNEASLNKQEIFVSNIESFVQWDRQNQV